MPRIKTNSSKSNANTGRGPRESAIQRAILDYLRLRRIYAVRINSGRIRISDPSRKTRLVKLADAGTPDILACLPTRPYGAFVAFEVKTDTGKLTDLQAARHEQIRESNGGAFVVRSVDDVRDVLRRYGL